MPFCHQPVIAWPCTGEDCFIAAEDPGNWILAEAPAAYRPRHPERAGFYQLFETHFDRYVRAYEERFEARSGPLRPVVVRSVEAFLTAGGCKDVSPGFAVRSAMTSTFRGSPAAQEISVRVARSGAPCSLPKNSPQKFSLPCPTGTGPFRSRVCCAAVQALGLVPTTESLQAPVEATADDYRLVRVRAAAGIAAFPRMTAPPAYQEQLKKAEQEYLASITARPDRWTSQYNMGNYQLSRGETKEAVASFEAALKLEPQAVTAMVNASIAHARLGEIAKAEKSLQKALKIAQDNAAEEYNLIESHLLSRTVRGDHSPILVLAEL